MLTWLFHGLHVIVGFVLVAEVDVVTALIQEMAWRRMSTSYILRLIRRNDIGPTSDRQVGSQVSPPE